MLAPAGSLASPRAVQPEPGVWHDELVYAPAEPPDRRSTIWGPGSCAGDIARSSAAERGSWFTPIRLLPPSRVGSSSRILPPPSWPSISCVGTASRATAVPASGGGCVQRPAPGWPTGARWSSGFLSSETLWTIGLHQMAPSMEEAIGRRDAFSGAVLCACVGKVLFGFSKRNPESIPRSLSRTVRGPVGRFRTLFEKLDLSYDDRAREAHARLSAGRGSAKEERHARRGAPDASVALRWRAEVSDADLATIRDVWERCDLPCTGSRLTGERRDHVSTTLRQKVAPALLDCRRTSGIWR